MEEFLKMILGEDILSINHRPSYIIDKVIIYDCKNKYLNVEIKYVCIDDKTKEITKKRIIIDHNMYFDDSRLRIRQCCPDEKNRFKNNLLEIQLLK